MSATAGMGHASAELLQEMQRAQQSMQQMEQSTQAQNVGGGAKFEAAMANQANGVQQTQQISQMEHVNKAPEASNILMQAKVGMADPTLGVQRVNATQKSGMQNMVKNLVDGQNKMEKIMNLAMSGRQFSPQEMIVMQAGVMRYSQEMDLTGKVIDKATSGIKQTMNTQV